MLVGATSVQPPVQPRCYPVQRRCVPPPYTPGAWHARTHLWVLRARGLVSGKGFAADVRHLPRLAAALTKAAAKATELGLIPSDDDDAEAIE
jgi:hypothetical protein